MASKTPPGRAASRSAGRRGGLQIFFLFLASLALLVLNRIDYAPVSAARERVSDVAAPLLDAASMPVVHMRRAGRRLAGLVNAAEELERLKEENGRLHQWEWRARLQERQLVHLRQLVKAVEEPALGFVTGRVIADAQGPFARSVLINIGRSQGVKPGYAAISGDGFVGRVVTVGDNASRVILVSDLSSRVPVLIGPGAVRAVLVGENTAQPRLELFAGGEDHYAGDEVYTSGDDGVLPRGLRIGAVADDGAGRRVRLHARLNELDYLSILFFDAPGLDGQHEGLSASLIETPLPPAGVARTALGGQRPAR